MVGARAQELVHEISIGTMDLDAVETCLLDRRFGGTAEVIDDTGKFSRIERARLGGLGKLALAIRLDQESLGFCPDRGRRHRLAAAGLQRVVRDASDVPKLDHDLAAGGMNGVRDTLPAGKLVGAIKAGPVEIGRASCRERVSCCV